MSMITWIKGQQLSTIDTKTTQIKDCQLSIICNYGLHFDDNLNKKLSTRSALLKVVGVAF